MQAFISHSFENKPEFENIGDALDQRSIPYWNPSEMKAASSLRGQLRSAVDKCGVCIFIATRHSINSSWCGAELGAFWGAGKPIITYVAEPSLAEDELPPIVQGDIWERRISRVAEQTKELLQSQSLGAQPTNFRRTSVAELTTEQLEQLIVGAVSFAAATSKSEGSTPSFKTVTEVARGAAGKVLAGIRATDGFTTHAENDWRNKILWVDDRPENNVYERQALESMGFEFTLALSTTEALQLLSTRRFAAIISDMGRKEGPREGYALLDAVRQNDKATPFFIYAGSRAPEHRKEADMHGAQGTTNMATELIDMIIEAAPVNQWNDL
ncbi:MAG: TIR domain-containing protein [Alphaproteobacteria bacterium]